MSDGQGEKVRPTATIEVPAKGGEKPDPDAPGGPPPGPAPPKEEDDGPELSEEDQELKTNLELAVTRVQDASADVQKAGLEFMSKELREATSSMTSVPKPLKFLSPHYDALKKWYAAGVAASNKAALADVLSTIGMVMGPEDREALKYKLEGNTEDIGPWGHEYVRHLAGEVGQEWTERSNAAQSVDDLLGLVKIIVPFHMAHNAEAEAIDLLMETGQLKTLPGSGHIDEANYARVCLYLLRCGDYVGDPEDAQEVFEVAYQLYFDVKQHADAVRVAVKLQDSDRIKQVFDACSDAATRKQLAYILGRHSSGFVVDEEEDDGEELNELIGNQSLAELFGTLARELDVTEAKTPEDIYKSHLAETGSTARNRESAPVSSARANLASTFVNAFVNAGYTTDKLVTPDDSKWLFQNKDHAVMSVTASLGMILQWHVEELSNIDKYLEADDTYAKGGALLAIGLACANVRSEFDPAKAVLEDYLEAEVTQPKPVRIGALLGLGLANAGSGREDIAALLMPFIADSSATADMEIVAIAGLALGLVQTGTADEDAASVIVERFMEATPAELDNPLALQLGLGLGLLFLGKTEAADAMVMAIETVEHPISKSVKLLVESCAYAGTGNVLKVQEMLHVCAEHPAGEEEKKKEEAGTSDSKDDDKKDDDPATRTKFMYQSLAVLGMSLVTMGEELGMDMISRTAEHLLQYGDTAVRRAVPLALALVHVSDPDYGIVDTLSKLTHDADASTAMSAIMGLGLVGAGTNNSRIAGLLRQLTVFYDKEPNQLFMTRLAQGLLHMAKGLMTISPFHSDKLLLSGPALGGLLSVVLATLNAPGTLLASHHYLMFTLAPAMRPRCLITLNEDMEPVHVDVRVGQAVDTVGQAGRPKTITGFQTHTTPVLLGSKDRAELADDSYEALSHVLEGFVVLRKKPTKGGGGGAGVGAGVGAGAGAGAGATK